MAKEETLRIFCFGDSLTAGYSAYGTVYHPYSIALTEKLSKDLSNTQVIAVDNGMPGDVVTQGAFAKRFESESSSLFLSPPVSARLHHPTNPPHPPNFYGIFVVSPETYLLRVESEA